MKKVLFIAFLIASLLIIKNISESIYTLWRKQDLVVSTKKKLEEERKKNEMLKKELLRVESESFVEEQARSRLFLVKEGETEIVLPLTEATESAKTPPLRPRPTWQLWLDLFF